MHCHYLNFVPWPVYKINWSLCRLHLLSPNMQVWMSVCVWVCYLFCVNAESKQHYRACRECCNDWNWIIRCVMQHSICILNFICFTGRHVWRALDEMKARREFMSRKHLRDTINKLKDMAPELLHLKPIEKDNNDAVWIAACLCGLHGGCINVIWCSSILR